MNCLNITTVGSLLFQHGQELEENTHAYTRNGGQRNTENINNFWHFPCMTCPLSRVHVQHSVHSFVLNVKIRDFHLAVCWLIIIMSPVHYKPGVSKHTSSHSICKQYVHKQNPEKQFWARLLKAPLN